jgi:SPW repeat
MTSTAHTQVPTQSHANQVRLASGLNVAVGAYALLAVWIGSASPANFWNAAIAGLAVLILAAYRMAGAAGPWASWTNAGIGLWLAISPWVYGYASDAGWLWNSILVGGIVFILGSWSASAGNAGRGDGGGV